MNHSEIYSEAVNIVKTLNGKTVQDAQSILNAVYMLLVETNKVNTESDLFNDVVREHQEYDGPHNSDD